MHGYAISLLFLSCALVFAIPATDIVASNVPCSFTYSYLVDSTTQGKVVVPGKCMYSDNPDDCHHGLIDYEGVKCPVETFSLLGNTMTLQPICCAYIKCGKQKKGSCMNADNSEYCAGNFIASKDCPGGRDNSMCCMPKKAGGGARRKDEGGKGVDTYIEGEEETGNDLEATAPTSGDSSEENPNDGSESAIMGDGGQLQAELYSDSGSGIPENGEQPQGESDADSEYSIPESG